MESYVLWRPIRLCFSPSRIWVQLYNTGVHEKDDLTEYIFVLLQAKAEHRAREQGEIA